MRTGRGTPVPAGGDIELAGWDVRIVLEQRLTSCDLEEIVKSARLAS